MDANEVNDVCNSCLAWEVKWNGEDDEEALAAMDETCGWNMATENYREYRDVTAPDDKDKFLGYVEAYNPLTFGCKGYLYPSRFYVVCHASAVNIAKALLRGDSGFKVKLNVPFEGGYPLHRAAANFSYDLLELLLAHGARTDVRTEGPDSVADLLPLNVAIEDTCLQLECWTQKDCVLRLILLLSLPEMKMFLDCISLLARHTDQTFKELLNYVEQGKLLQTALQDKQITNRSGLSLFRTRMVRA